MNGLIGRTISHYTILEQIGQGGMSSVFRATALGDGRAVAMKILSPYIAHEERFQARFEREIKLLRRLQHPNIIPILDFGEADGLAFIVMPYISSGTLLDRLNRGPLDPSLGGRIVDQLASALMLAHQNGVIHRDVKPSNVLIDEDGNALLSDFSFARSQDASQNLTGSALIGTPAYMSPEQCRGDAIDARSDQYSFGIMLFQITTGSLPFTGDSPMATALQHVNTPLPLPRMVNPNLPEGIELVLIKALAKDPALRFESMEALNRAFQAALAAAMDPAARYAAANGKTLTSQRTMAMYRKYQNVTPRARRRWFERSAVLATLLLLLACTVSAGAIYVIRQDIFGPVDAASALVDVPGTVSAFLTANPPPPGTVLAPGEYETAIYLGVMQAAAETRVAAGGPSSTPAPATETLLPTLPGGTILPTLTPGPTRTLRPGETPPTSTKTPFPSATPTLGATSAATASATGGSTSVATSTDLPTAVPSATSPGSTSAPTATPVPPSSTSQPPSSTPQPPSSTPQPPTPTRTATRTPQTPMGQLTQDAKKTQTAAAAQPTSTP